MRSLYSTFVVATLAVMFVSALLAFMLSNAYYQHVLKPQNDEKYTNISLVIVDFIESNNYVNLHEHLEFIANIGYQLKLVAADGSTTFYGKPFRTKDLEPDIIDNVLKGEVYHGMAMFPRETFVTGFFANELENSIGVSFVLQEERYALFLRPDITLHFNEMRHLFAWLLGLTIIFSLIFELVLAKYLIRPLSKLNEATKKIKEGDFSLHLDFKRKDEIGELASSFQDMTAQLKELENMRNEFISNISHDIQSPLSNINGYTELLGNENVTNEQKKEYLFIIREETNRLSSLTSQLLLLTSINQISELRERKEFSLTEQIKSLIMNYKWKLEDKEIALQYSLPNTNYRGDPSLLLSVWDNLLSNAIKYNKKGGNIIIVIKEEKENLLVIFQDTGIGLSPVQQKDIFERFYRADTSRTKEVEGTGLGLSIASKIVSLHGGEILVRSVKEKETIFTVKLPKSKM